MCWEMNKHLSKDEMQMFDEHKKYSFLLDIK